MMSLPYSARRGEALVAVCVTCGYGYHLGSTWRQPLPVLLTGILMTGFSYLNPLCYRHRNINTYDRMYTCCMSACRYGYTHVSVHGSIYLNTPYGCVYNIDVILFMTIKCNKSKFMHMCNLINVAGITDKFVTGRHI